MTDVARPNAQQIVNLTVLANYLDALPANYGRFSMQHFCVTDDAWLNPTDAAAARINECGACACAVGHGPAAGLKATVEDTSWNAYSARVFGADPGEVDSADEPNRFKRTLWYRLFDDHHPDDVKAAVKRIRKVIAENQFTTGTTGNDKTDSIKKSVGVEGHNFIG